MEINIEEKLVILANLGEIEFKIHELTIRHDRITNINEQLTDQTMRLINTGRLLEIGENRQALIQEHKVLSLQLKMLY